MNLTPFFIILLPLLCIEFEATIKSTSTKLISFSCKNYYSSSLKKNIYTTVEEEPEFPGGMAGYQRFLNKNLKYPQVDSGDLESIQSTVKIKFIVDTNGQIKNTVALHHNSSDEAPTPLEKEVLRVFRLMPPWKPGKCNGKTVAVELTWPMVICSRGDD